jgi:hypothetical protein
MGAELFSVSVEEVSGSTCVLRVTAIHPDAGPPNASFVFVFCLIVDPCIGFEFNSDESVQRSPLAREVSLDDYLDSELLKSNARGFVARVEVVSRDAGSPPPSDRSAWRSYWREGDRPAVQLRVTATDPAWLAHLRTGMRYATAAWQDEPGDPWPAGIPARRPGDTAIVLSEDGMDGMRTRHADDEWLASHVQRLSDPEQARAEYVIPVHGHNHYAVRTSVIDRPDGGAVGPAERAAIRALAGQPILYSARRAFEPRAVGCLLCVSEGGGEEDKASTLTVFAEGAGSYGTSTFRLDDVLSLGRAFHQARGRALVNSLSH